MCIVLCLYLIYIITFLLLKIKRKIEKNPKIVIFGRLNKNGRLVCTI